MRFPWDSDVVSYLWIGLLLGVGAAACSGNADRTGEEHNDDFRGCPADSAAFGLGLQAVGEHYSAKVVSADPPEPERYSNDWLVELSVPDVQIERAQTFMPIHGHDGRVEPEIIAQGQAGQVEIGRLNFTMRGPWEVRLWLRSPSGTADYLVFHVCVAK
jgi:hypothetical protein